MCSSLHLFLSRSDRRSRHSAFDRESSYAIFVITKTRAFSLSLSLSLCACAQRTARNAAKAAEEGSGKIVALRVRRRRRFETTKSITTNEKKKRTTANYRWCRSKAIRESGRSTDRRSFRKKCRGNATKRIRPRMKMMIILMQMMMMMKMFRRNERGDV